MLCPDDPTVPVLDEGNANHCLNAHLFIIGLQEPSASATQPGLTGAAPGSRLPQAGHRGQLWQACNHQPATPEVGLVVH
jgi:hypothetical protein